MGHNDVAESVKKVLEEGPFTQKQAAKEIGLGYDALYSWAHGLRTPRAKNLERLAAFLDERGDRLKSLAEELRRAAQS